MDEFVDILDESGFKRFLDAVEGLHDGLVREVAFVARGYVSPDLEMWGDTDPADVRLIIQTQNPRVPCVEILATGVTVCRVDTGATTLELAAAFASDGVTLFLEGQSQSDHSMIVATRLSYVVRGREWLGSTLHAVLPFGKQSNEARER